MNEHPPEWVPYATRPARPSFWSVIGLSLRSVWHHRYVCGLLALPYAALSTLPLLAVETFGSGSSGLPSGTGLELDEVLVLGALFVAVTGTLLLASLLVYPATLGATSLVGTAALFGEPVELKGILRTLGDRAFAGIGTFLLIGLAAAAAPVVAIVAGVVVASILGSDVGLIVAVALVAASLVVSIVLGVRLWLAIPATVVEGLGPIEALRRSWELVRGGFWRIFGALVVLNIVVAIESLLLTQVSELVETGFGSFLIRAGLGMLAVGVAASVVGVGTGVLYAGQVLQHSDEPPRPEPSAPSAPSQARLEPPPPRDPASAPPAPRPEPPAPRPEPPAPRPEPPTPRPEPPPPAPPAPPPEPPRPEGPVPPQEDAGSK